MEKINFRNEKIEKTNYVDFKIENKLREKIEIWIKDQIFYG